MIEIDRERICTDWASRGFSCELWVDPPGQRWDDFVHPVDEIVVVLAGEMEFEIESRMFHPEEGEELLIPAGAVHSTRNLGQTTSHWLYGYRLR